MVDEQSGKHEQAFYNRRRESYEIEKTTIFDSDSYGWIRCSVRR